MAINCETVFWMLMPEASPVAEESVPKIEEATPELALICPIVEPTEACYPHGESVRFRFNYRSARAGR